MTLGMNVTSIRKRSLTLAALAMLASGALAAAPAHAAALDDHGKSNDGRSSSSDGGRQADQGVVQSVSTRAIVLKALDGSVFSIPVDGSTRFYVGDTPASLGDIKPGFVVTGKWKDGAAEEVRAFNPSPAPTVSTVSTVSTVASVRADRIVVTAPDGSSTTIRVSDRTREYVDGKRGKLRDVKPGYTLLTSSVNGSKDGKAADELRFGKR
jgi:hypothetical protein